MTSREDERIREEALVDLGVSITYGAEIPEGYKFEYSGPDDGGALHYWELTDPDGFSALVLGDAPANGELPNDNCLAGMRCPNEECRSYGPFQITIMTVAEMYDDGFTQDHGDSEWDTDSPISCPCCSTSGTVYDFSEDKNGLESPATTEEEDAACENRLWRLMRNDPQEMVDELLRRLTPKEIREEF